MKKKLNLFGILYIFLVFPFFRIECLVHISSIDTLYDILKIISAFIVILLIIFNGSRQSLKFDKYFICFNIYIFIVFISALLHNNLLNSIIYQLPNITLVYLLFYIKAKKHFTIFFKYVGFFFSLFIVLNFIGLILFPNGIYQEINVVNMHYSEIIPVNFLGKDNAIGIPLIGMISFTMVRDYLIYGSLLFRTKILFLIVCFSILIMWSATALVGMIVYICILIFIKRKKFINRDILNFKFLFYVIVIFTVGVVVFQIQDYFAFFINNILNKDVTLSNRTNVWNMSFDYIENNFKSMNYIFGLGLNDYSLLLYNNRYAHCHCQFLNIFINSGFIGLAMYIKLLSLSLKSLTNDIMFSRNSFFILACCIISFSIMFIAEVYNFGIIFMISYLLYLITSEKKIFVTRIKNI